MWKQNKEKKLIARDGWWSKRFVAIGANKAMEEGRGGQIRRAREGCMWW